MGKFELAPPIDVRLEPIIARFVLPKTCRRPSFTPAPRARTFKSWSPSDLKMLGLCVLCAVRPTVCVVIWFSGQAVGRRECQSIPVDISQFFIPAGGNLRFWLPAIGASRAPAAPQGSAPSSVNLDTAAARHFEHWPPIDCLVSRRLAPLKPERVRGEDVQYEAAAAQTADNRGISALVSSEPPPNGKQCRTSAQRWSDANRELKHVAVGTRSGLSGPSGRRGRR
jgi:hypothetical protein